MAGRKGDEKSRVYPLTSPLFKELVKLAADISEDVIGKDGLTHGKLAEMAVKYLLSLDQTKATEVAREGAAYCGHGKSASSGGRGSKVRFVGKLTEGHVDQLPRTIDGRPKRRTDSHSHPVVELHDPPLLGIGQPCIDERPDR